MNSNQIGGEHFSAIAASFNAQVAYVAPSATIRADATQNGNGGKVIVWAEDTTRYFGDITSKGGVHGGNGGFVEISGKRWLGYAGLVNTTAPQGATGSLLLDPTDVTISVAASDATLVNTGGVYTNTITTPSNIQNSALVAQLGATNVTVSTASGLGGFGDITVTDPVVWATANSLTLSANRNIVINAALTGTSGGIVLNAPTGTISAPAAVISANTLQVTSSGAASFAAMNQVNTLAANVTAGIFTFENALPAGLTIGTVGAMNGVSASGAITIRQNTSGGIAVNQNVASSASDVMLGIASGAGGITTNAIVSGLNTQVYTSGGGIAVNAGLTAATGTATLYSGVGAITGTGQINANTIALQSTGGTGNIGTSLPAPLTTSSIGGAGNANISIGFNATGPSAVYLGHIGDATLQQVFTTGAGTPVNIASSNNLTVANINTGTADLNLAAGNLLSIPALTNLSGANISLGGNLIDIIATASINAGGGVVWLHPSTPGRAIDLVGAKAGLPNTLELSTSELNTVTAGTLRVGAMVAGNFNISAAISPAGTSVLSLESGGVVTQAVAGTITETNLAVIAGNNVALDTAPNSVTNLAAQVSGGASNFSFKNAGALNVANSIDGVSGILTPGMTALISGGALTQTPGALALLGSTSLYAEGSSVLLNNANPVGVIAGKATGGAFDYTSSNGIQVTTVNSNAGIQASGVMLHASSSGIGTVAPINAGVGGVSMFTTGNSNINSTINASTIYLESLSGIGLGPSASLTASGVATIILNAGTGGFANNSSLGAAALSAPSSRWLVYAANPGLVNKNGLTSNFRHYNATYANYANPGETGNGFIYASLPGTLSVDTTLVSGTASNIFGQPPTAVFGIAMTVLPDKEDVSGAPVFTPVISSTTPAGNYSVSYAGGFTSATSFSGPLSAITGVPVNPVSYSFVAGTGLPYIVSPATLTLITASLTGTASKTYDGTNTATLAPGNFLLSGFISTDSATVTQTTGTYAGPNVGSGILVSTTLVATDFSPVGSTNLANYTLPTSASGPIGSITPAPLTITANPASKIYNGQPYSGGNGVSYAGLVNGETAAVLSGILTYGGTSQGAVNVGNYLITPGGLTSGNYNIAFVDGSLTISQLAVNLVLTGNKVYDGTTTFSTAQLGISNAISGDSVSLSAGTADTADKNVGANKPFVSFSGLALTGASAGNYTLTGASGAGTITARPLSTWSGAGGNSLWSNPANWDALPDGNNVLAVSIPTAGSVTFDGAVALQALTSAGNMALNGNNLSVGSYLQTGGNLTGTGNLNVGNSFSQAGGTISLAGAAIANITQSGGDLNIAHLSAPAANLTASTGTITQTGPIIVASLTTQSATGTTLTDIGNQIFSFSANNSSSGNIALTNTGVLTIAGINNGGGNILVDNTGAVSTTGPVSARGAVSITAHSPLTIGSTISAGGMITLTAGTAGSPAASDIITLNGAISGSGIALAAHSVTGTASVPPGAVLEIFKEPDVATPVVIDNLVSDILVIPPPLEAPVQAPAADATAADDEKKKDNKVAAQDAAAPVAEPAPAVAALPVCK